MISQSEKKLIDFEGALLVYDITDADSFQRVQNWVKELRKMLGTDIVLAIAGNKIDLERNRVVPLDKAEAYAQSVGAKHFSTSSKLNKGLHEMFLDMTKSMFLPDLYVTFGRNDRKENERRISNNQQF